VYVVQAIATIVKDIRPPNPHFLLPGKRCKRTFYPTLLQAVWVPLPVRSRSHFVAFGPENIFQHQETRRPVRISNPL
jgi:hypothetical protein